MSRSSLAVLRPPPHACTRGACPAPPAAAAAKSPPPAAVADPPPGPRPPLVALGPDSVGELQPFVAPPGACEPWLCSALEPTFDCPADRLTDVAELLAAGAIPPAALELYSPRSADQLRRLVAVLHYLSASSEATRSNPQPSQGVTDSGQEHEVKTKTRGRPLARQAAGYRDAIPPG